jgi:hypothetical protein
MLLLAAAGALEAGAAVLCIALPQLAGLELPQAAIMSVAASPAGASHILFIPVPVQVKSRLPLRIRITWLPAGSFTGLARPSGGSRVRRPFASVGCCRPDERLLRPCRPGWAVGLPGGDGDLGLSGCGDFEAAQAPGRERH